MSPVATIVKQGRESGIGVCLSVSVLGAVARMILTNANHHVFFRLGDERSLAEARNTLILPNGAEVLLPALKRGECLYRGGAWPHALLGKIDYVAPSRGSRPARFDNHPFIAALPLKDMPHVQEAVGKRVGEYGQMINRQNRQAVRRLSPLARKLMVEASLNPWLPVARLFERIGVVSRARQLAVKKELEGSYAEFAEARLGKRNVLLIALLPPAWELLGKSDVALSGRGGLIHRTLAHWICMVGERRGLASQVELIVEGTNHPVDAGWFQPDGTLSLFECVVDSIDNLVSHLRTLAKARPGLIREVTVVAIQMKILNELREMIEKSGVVVPFVVSYQVADVYESELFGHEG